MDEPSLKVKVILFAALREAAGQESATLLLPEGASLAMVWPRLLQRFPQLKGFEPSVAWAVNHAYAKLDALLKDGDEVAVLPPISGG
jgi:molybdopterin converting factor subunit 1